MRKVYLTKEEYNELQGIKLTETGFIIDSLNYPNLFKRMIDPTLGVNFTDDISYAINYPESIEITNLEQISLSARGYAITESTNQFLAKNPFGNVVLMDEPEKIEGYELIFTIEELVALNVIELVNFIPEDEFFMGEIIEVPQLQYNEFIDLKNRHESVEDAISEILDKGRGTWFQSIALSEITVDEFISIWNGEIELDSYWS